MITTYIMDIRQLTPPELFKNYYDAMPYERQEKINALRQEPDRRRSLAAGILLMYGLAERNIQTEQLSFCYGPHHKPYLKHMPQIQFNLSHAGNYALACFGTKELGIDIEQIGRSINPRHARFCTEREQAYLGRISEKSAWDQAFVKLWTRKESFIKAIGAGLSFPLNEVETLENNHAETPFHRQCQSHLWLFYEYQIEGYQITVCSQETSCQKELIWISPESCQFRA